MSKEQKKWKSLEKMMLVTLLGTVLGSVKGLDKLIEKCTKEDTEAKEIARIGAYHIFKDK